MKATLATIALACLAAAGCFAVRAVSSVVPNAASDDPHGAYLSIIRQAPFPVVQEATGWGVLIVVWVMFAALAAGGWMLVRALQRETPPAAPDRQTTDRRIARMGAAFALVLAVLTCFPISQSIDVYYYAAYARLYGVHGINPYELSSPLHLGDPTLDDNLKPLSNPPFPDSYGPGFTLVAGVVGRVEAGAPLWWQVWTWRALAALAALAVLGALTKMTRSVAPADRLARLGRYAFNPLVMYEAAAGGHNDWLMVAPALWAFALVDDMPLIAGLLLGVAISVKYMAAIAVPFAAIRAWRNSRAAGTLLPVLAACVPVLFARPFVMGESAAQTLVTVGSQVSMSINWLLALPFFRSGNDISSALPGIPPLPLLGLLTWPRLIQSCIVGAMAAVVLVSVWRYARLSRASDVFRSTAALLWAIPALHPWYLSWMSPALAAEGTWSTFAAWYLGLGLLLYAHEGVMSTPGNEAVFVIIAAGLLVAPVFAALRAGRGMRAAPAIKPD
jgi:hypothetical protein